MNANQFGFTILLCFITILYYFMLVYVRIDSKGYYDEIPRNKFIVYFLIPFSWTIVSVYQWFKE
jgi:hypothetical protein